MTTEKLDQKFGVLKLTEEGMATQGGDEHGYEQVRAPESQDDYFELDFELGTEAHREWVQNKTTTS